MKCAYIPAGIFLGLSLLHLPVLAQDSVVSTNAATDATPANAVADAAPTNAASKAAAVAEQQGVDEKFKQLTADIESLRTANQLLLDKLSALKDDLQQIRAEQTRLATNSVARDDLKLLAQRIEEVDKKRQDDKDTISEEIKKSAARLEKLLTTATEPVSKPPSKPVSNNEGPATENGFIYVIKDGDTLEAIRSAYNAEFKSKGMKTITQKQAMEANPDVDWNRLKIGQKIVIPRPAE